MGSEHLVIMGDGHKLLPLFYLMIFWAALIILQVLQDSASILKNRLYGKCRSIEFDAMHRCFSQGGLGL